MVTAERTVSKSRAWAPMQTDELAAAFAGSVSDTLEIDSFLACSQNASPL